MRRRSAASGHPRRRDSGALRVPMLAGWLFADLFLVLFIVVFSSQPTVATPKPKPVAIPSAHPSAAPSPKHSPAAKPPARVGLEPAPVNIDVSVSPAQIDNPATRAQAAAQLLASLNRQLAAGHHTGLRAGFVLVFAGSVAGASDPIDEAVHVATLVIPILQKQDGRVFAATSGEGLWGGANNLFHFQIFFFAS
jgi:hypothetical protein